VTPLLTGALYGLLAGVAIALAALFGVWWERKVAGRIQLRFGPQQAGPAGLFQTVADTVKLVLKEDITPAAVDRPIYKWAPLFVFAPLALSLTMIPLAVGFAPLDSGVGILLFLAVPAVSVLGVLLAGWSSANTLATIGGMRAAAQMISYEVPRTLSVLGLVVVAGSLQPTVVMGAWRWWWIPLFAVGFLVYLISSLAEMNSVPFDLPQAESELVAGYFSDYSGIRWAIFMMSEYGAIVSACVFGSAVFLGGANGLPGLLGGLVILVKAIVMTTLVVWIKWTFPRFRQDQLMAFAWKVLTPLALLQLLVAGVVAIWL
jgi:NADH-quinone oxidoreductase subunit H